jgi:hypothetical protein
VCVAALCVFFAKSEGVPPALCRGSLACGPYTPHAPPFQLPPTRGRAPCCAPPPGRRRRGGGAPPRRGTRGLFSKFGLRPHGPWVPRMRMRVRRATPRAAGVQHACPSRARVTALRAAVCAPRVVGQATPEPTTSRLLQQRRCAADARRLRRRACAAFSGARAARAALYTHAHGGAGHGRPRPATQPPFARPPAAAPLTHHARAPQKQDVLAAMWCVRRGSGGGSASQAGLRWVHVQTVHGCVCDACPRCARAAAAARFAMTCKRTRCRPQRASACRQVAASGR